jgi:hypothetical protein
MFANPKARRLHLIAAHAYPKEYFFAITNKGIGGLLRRWGEGASLLRGQWRARDSEENAEGDEESVSQSQRLSPHQHSDSDGEGIDDIAEGKESFAPDSASASALPDQDAIAETIDKGDRDADADAEVDALARDVSALGLIPSSVSFGRGGPAPRGRAGLATRSGRPAACHIGHHQPPPDANNHRAAVNNKGKDKDVDGDMEVEEPNSMGQDSVVPSDKTPPSRGRRGRGRVSGDGRGSGGRGAGRGRGFVPPPPRGGFLLRGAAGRGFPRGLIGATMRARGRGAGV